MKLSILTPDSKIPNLAAMKISAFHKSIGDEVYLDFPIARSEFTYASILYSWTPDPIADLVGGSKYPKTKLDSKIDSMKPDYLLYPTIDYSLGYTYKACPRTCDFCIVPKQNNDEKHYSIWDFHDSKFKKICLLNNNTLADLNWRETFEELLDADLIVIDHGYDARLITEESADYLARIRFDNYLHIAWDFPEHEKEIMQGIKYLKQAGIKNLMCYVLIGNTTHEEDLYRVLKLQSLGVDPFVMPLDKRNRYQRRFARWCNQKAIFKSVKWEDYR